MNVCCVCMYPQRPEEVVRCLGTGLRGRGESPTMLWVLVGNLGPLLDQRVLVVTKPSLHPAPAFFLLCPTIL